MKDAHQSLAALGRADFQEEAAEADLVRRCREGDRDSIEALVRRHQAWVFNLALRMVWSPEDARDVSQEILLKALTKLSTFRGESTFRTWLFRIAANHMLNMRRRGAEPMVTSFEEYGARINACPDDVLPDPRTVPVDPAILELESKLACTSGMLLCLDREQRLVLILGAIMGVSDEVGAEVMEISRPAFRKKLSRARQDLRRFMMGQCGLVNPANPCRCAKKTRAYIQAGVVNPANLRFYSSYIRTVNEVVGRKAEALEAWLRPFGELPFQDPPDLAAAIRVALESPDFGGATEIP